MSARFLVARLPASLVCAALLVGVTGAQAVTAKVTVRDTQGRPLPDAVVMIEPTAARAAVKPMAPVEIAQAKRQFAPRITVVTVGTPVNFPNFDTVRHQVYSFSPVKTFELKLYAGVPSAPVVFDKPGVAVLGCSIHDQMAAWVVVSDTPYFARSGADGSTRVDDLPAGAYRLRVWHSRLPVGPEPTAQPFVVSGTEASAEIRLPVEDAL
jgi:plastocyanin